MKLIFKLVISISCYIFVLSCFAMESASIVDIWQLKIGNVVQVYETLRLPLSSKNEFYGKYTIIGFRTDKYIVLESSTSKEPWLVKHQELEKMAVAKSFDSQIQIGELVYFDTNRTGIIEGYFRDNSVLIKRSTKRSSLTYKRVKKIWPVSIPQIQDPNEQKFHIASDYDAEGIYLRPGDQFFCLRSCFGVNKPYFSTYTVIGFSNNLIETDQGMIDVHKKIDKFAFKKSYFKGVKVGDKVYGPDIKEGQLLGSFLNGTALVYITYANIHAYYRQKSVSPIVFTAEP